MTGVPANPVPTLNPVLLDEMIKALDGYLSLTRSEKVELQGEREGGLRVRDRATVGRDELVRKSRSKPVIFPCVPIAFLGLAEQSTDLLHLPSDVKQVRVGDEMWIGSTLARSIRVGFRRQPITKLECVFLPESILAPRYSSIDPSRHAGVLSFVYRYVPTVPVQIARSEDDDIAPDGSRYGRMLVTQTVWVAKEGTPSLSQSCSAATSSSQLPNMSVVS
jgi:hypothetical protein